MHVYVCVDGWMDGAAGISAGLEVEELLVRDEPRRMRMMLLLLLLLLLLLSILRPSHGSSGAAGPVRRGGG